MAWWWGEAIFWLERKRGEKKSFYPASQVRKYWNSEGKAWQNGLNSNRHADSSEEKLASGPTISHNSMASLKTLPSLLVTEVLCFSYGHEIIRSHKITEKWLVRSAWGQYILHRCPSANSYCQTFRIILYITDWMTTKLNKKEKKKLREFLIRLTQSQWEARVASVKHELSCHLPHLCL